MKVEYHMKKLLDHEQADVRKYVEHHISGLQYADRHCKENSPRGGIQVKCTIDKTQEKHCKYTVNLHISGASKGAPSVIVNEGFNLIKELQNAFDAITHKLEHVIDRDKEKRAPRPKCSPFNTL